MFLIGRFRLAFRCRSFHFLPNASSNLDLTSEGSAPLINTTFSLADAPLIILNDDREKPVNFPKYRTSSVLALPSTGGADRRTTICPRSSSNTKALRDALGVTRTAMVTPSEWCLIIWSNIAR